MAKKSNVTPIVPIETLLGEYDNLREQKKIIEKRLGVLSDQIKVSAETLGTKDDKGSYYAEKGNYIFGKQCKKSVSFDKDKAISFFKKRGYKDCIATVETVDEEAVEARINSGDISFEDLEGITNTKVSYAVDVKKKEEMPEVEQTTVPLAASKKPTRLVPKGGKK